jgi:flagellar basal-body rod modification protein FlgD
METDTNRRNFESARQSLGSNKLGSDAFLKLMLAQLKYQDPTNPVSNQEFLQQQAMFTQVEKLDDLNKNTAIIQASNLTGKIVQIEDAQSGQPITGTVSETVVNGSQLQVKVNDTLYPASSILKLYAQAPTSN